MKQIIKIDGSKNYYMSDIGKSKHKFLDPVNKFKLVITMDDNSKLIVDDDKIKIDNGGSRFFEYNGTKYVIDDPDFSSLIRTGYIVLDDFDTIQNNKEAGKIIRKMINEIIFNILDVNVSADHNWTKLIINNDNLEVTINDGCFRYHLKFDTVNRIVNKNISRREQQLPFYPFDKNMDKFGTYYLSVFCERICDMDILYEPNKEKYPKADQIIDDIISSMNHQVIEVLGKPRKFKFHSLDIRKKIYDCETI